MRKIKSIFKVLTFINIEIFVMITFMLFTIGFGINYTKNTIDYTERLSFKIKENSLISSKLSENMSQFNLIDNLILSKSLKGEDISGNITHFISYSDSFMLNKFEKSKIDSLLNLKRNLFYQIMLSKKKSDISVRMVDIKDEKVVPLYVEKNSYTISKKRFFKKAKIDTIKGVDTLYNKVVDINKSKLEDKVSQIRKNDDETFQSQIYLYNSLSYQIRHMLNFKISLLNDRNIKTQETLIKSLNERFIDYIIIITITLVLFILCVLFLIHDIRKKSKVENRYRHLVSLLLSKKKS